MIEPKLPSCVVCGLLGKPSKGAIGYLTEGTVMIKTLTHGDRAVCAGCITQGVREWARRADLVSKVKDEGPKGTA